MKNLFEDYEYLALYQESYSEPGWGKDDPPSTNYRQTYTGFKNEGDMLAWVKETETSLYSKKDYVVIKCTKVDISIEVTAKVR